MILLIVLFVLVAGLAIWLGPLLQQDTSYVLIAVADYTIEMRLPVLLLLIFGSYLLLWLASWLLRRVTGAGQRLAQFGQRRSIRRMRHKLLRGFVGVAEGDWSLAEKNMLATAKESPLSVINYLIAAQAAQAQGALARRDSYLQQAYQHHPDATLAIALTEAQLYIAKQQYEAAQQVLGRLHDSYPKNEQVLKLLLQVYQALQDWRNVVSLLPILQKKRLLSGDELEALQQKAYPGYWQQLATEGKVADLINVWQHSPQSIRSSVLGISKYAQLLIAQGDMAEARQVLQKALNQQWNTELLALYVRCDDPDVVKRIHQCERWLQTHPDERALLYLLAQLCVQQKLWGKAIDALLAAIKLQSDAPSLALLSHAYQQLGESAPAQHTSQRLVQLLLKDKH